jgi:hypothetical protein
MLLIRRHGGVYPNGTNPSVLIRGEDHSMATQQISGVAAVDERDPLKRGGATVSRMVYSRLIGALFLAGFFAYGTGSILVASVTGRPDFLSTIAAHQTILVFGAFLMLLNTAVEVGKGVLFFPILENHSERTALAYLSTMIVEVVFLSLGALFLLLIVPLSQHAGEDWARGLGALLVQSNTLAYQVGQAVLGFGALFLCALLLRTGLIPRWLAISGLVGYAFLMAGQIAELFGIHVGTYSVIPGFFFEIAFPFWLFFKGFQAEAYGHRLLTTGLP